MTTTREGLIVASSLALQRGELTSNHEGGAYDDETEIQTPSDNKQVPIKCFSRAV